MDRDDPAPVSQNEDVILTFPKDLRYKYTIDWPTGAEAVSQ